MEGGWEDGKGGRERERKERREEQREGERECKVVKQLVAVRPEELGIIQGK